MFISSIGTYNLGILLLAMVSTRHSFSAEAPPACFNWGIYPQHSVIIRVYTSEVAIDILTESGTLRAVCICFSIVLSYHKWTISGSGAELCTCSHDCRSHNPRYFHVDACREITIDGNESGNRKRIDQSLEVKKSDRWIDKLDCSYPFAGKYVVFVCAEYC